MNSLDKYISEKLKSNYHSDRTHWTWYLLLLVAGVLICIALIFNDSFVEQWFSADGHISDGGRSYLKFLRIGLLLISGACIILWFLRNIIVSYIEEAVECWKRNPPELKASDLVPPIKLAYVRNSLLLILSAWIVFVIISLVPGYETLAARITIEGGATETLTVVFYLFACIIAITSAISCLRQNSQRRLNLFWLFALAAGCFFIAGEEINWGQIYLHYDTPEIVKQSNVQRELSLHNIVIPFLGYWANDMLQLLAICGGIVLPIMIRFSSYFRRIIWAVDFPIPPWLSQCYFFIAALIPQDHVIQLQPANIPSELREVTIAFGVAIWLWTRLRNQDYHNSLTVS